MNISEEGTSMRAVIVNNCGNPQNVLRVNLNYPTPEFDPDSDEVMIQVFAASGNVADVQMIKGEYSQDTVFPFIPGLDFSGKVIAVGVQCSRIKPGDEVFGALTQGGMSGTLIIPEEFVWPKPSNLSHVEAAAVGYAGLATYQALKYRAQLKIGHTVLVLGAQTALGRMGIQMAKCLGAAHIIAALSVPSTFVLEPDTSAPALEALGAEMVVYDNWPEVLPLLRPSSFHIVLDCEGNPDSWRRSQLLFVTGSGYFIAFRKPVRRNISKNSQPSKNPQPSPQDSTSSTGTHHKRIQTSDERGEPREKMSILGASLLQFSLQLPATVDLCNIASLCELGHIKPLIAQHGVYSMGDVMPLFSRLEDSDGPPRGSVVLLPQEYEDEIERTLIQKTQHCQVEAPPEPMGELIELKTPGDHDEPGITNCISAKEFLSKMLCITNDSV